MHLARLASLLLALFALVACAGKQPQTTTIEPSETLPKVSASRGENVWIDVKGGDSSLNEDLHSMLTAWLQSERGLSPVDAPDQAKIVVAVNLGDTVSLGTHDKPMRGTQALAGTAMGAGLGALLGSAFGRYGTGVGAGAGALLGLGVTWLDNRGKSSLWALRARVGIRSDGTAPQEKDMRALVVTAEGDRMDKKEILPALEDALCQKIVGAFSQ